MEQLGLELKPQRQVFTVGEITVAVRGLLEQRFGDCWVSGEVSNARRAPSGHWYFTLKDGDAQLKCVCFRQNALYLKVKPKDGLDIVARGRVSVYEARGEYQLYVEAVEPLGYGALQLAFEQLKRKLEDEGLFDEERKRALPRFPRRIGIVTSPTGAAIADMLRVLERRFPGLHVRLYPVRVQGDGAAEEIARGLKSLNDSGWPEIVLVGRGGGSLEDLWAFNEEVVARAIAQSKVPVVSAVGHQTDFTIADFVADLRAPTPSAAAELAVSELREVLDGLIGFEHDAAQALRYRVAMLSGRLTQAGVERPGAALRRRLGRAWQRNDDLQLRLREAIVRRIRSGERRFRNVQHSLAEQDLRVRLGRVRSRLTSHGTLLGPSMERRLERPRAQLAALSGRLESLSPTAILERGYAIVLTADGSAVRSAAQVAPGDTLGVRLGRGRLGVRVERSEEA